jgi:hypothetical protein
MTESANANILALPGRRERYFAKHFWSCPENGDHQVGPRGTDGIDTRLSIHGYSSAAAKTDGQRPVARDVPAFRRAGAPSRNRRAARGREPICIVRAFPSQSTAL